MAKEAREIRRQSSPELSEEEQASLIRESQYQKAEYKRLEKEWKKRLEELETEVRHFDIEIERLKTERKERSAALQRKLFEQFRMLNAQGEVKDLYTIFEQTVQKVPPAGAGECALLISGGATLLKTISGITDIIILPAKGSANRFCNTCCKDWR